ncbi:MAG TPA: extensin family protein, partial [Polyangiaceae bacterium]|nr:extensin family protein [Polyangiaceae bacterium]
LTRARYSGAYVYRTTRTGRLSHHAHGLALDLHDLEIGGQLLSVKKDFARSVACEKAEQPLNRLACALREAHAFEELLTPDYNADHYDHLHLAVARGPLLRFERDQALAAAKEQHAALLRAARAIEEAKKKSGTSSAATAASMPTPAPAPAIATSPPVTAQPTTTAPAAAPATVAPTTAPATVAPATAPPTVAPITSPPAPAEDAQPSAPTDEGTPPPPPPPLEDASVTVRVASATA